MWLYFHFVHPVKSWLISRRVDSGVSKRNVKLNSATLWTHWHNAVKASLWLCTIPTFTHQRWPRMCLLMSCLVGSGVLEQATQENIRSRGQSKSKKPGVGAARFQRPVLYRVPSWGQLKAIILKRCNRRKNGMQLALRDSDVFGWLEEVSCREPHSDLKKFNPEILSVVLRICFIPG